MKPFGSFPGGKVEFDETEEETIARELLEEVKITILNNIQHIMILKSDYKVLLNENNADYIFSIFSATTSQKNIKLSPDHVEYMWAE